MCNRGAAVSDDQHLRGPSRHVNGYHGLAVLQKHLGRCDVLVARAKDLVHLQACRRWVLRLWAVLQLEQQRLHCDMAEQQKRKAVQHFLNLLRAGFAQHASSVDHVPQQGAEAA